MKKFMFLLMASFLLVLSACGSDEVETAEKAKIEEEKAKIEEVNTKVAGEETNEPGTKYDDLPLTIRVHLATTIVDERAEYDLTADDKLFVQVHSGAGVGHPVYKIQIDSDNIIPIDGVVNISAIDIEEATVNSSPISKEDLYDDYLEHKDIYESGQSNVNEVDDYIIENNESMKDEI